MKLNQRPVHPSQKDDTDKYAEYKVDFHANEPCDVTDKGCMDRHRDKVLEQICDSHPSAPMCKVYDD